ncbi:glutaredoxin family protein [Glaciecola sp. MH2013]|uniref:glutaredoxin family protein n=1 Tax=Glaciecola sp. MH2013 TaxID=2785524 RepID=UPI00189E0A88|nr:glutaredoxin family protein [Glaciecola sp. MH2013]MBF7072799.1 glutaredoxin family protein [Glaciecola sp. MH2013]
MILTLYTGPQCSLCDLAEELINELNKSGASLQLVKVNVRQSAELYHLYGARIPVLKRKDNDRELGWPFGLSELSDFIQ